MNDDIYMLWLSSMVQQINSRKLNDLLSYFGTAREIFNASDSDLSDALRTAPQAERIIKSQRNLQYIEDTLKNMESKGIAYFSRNHERFPSLLKEIPDPPLGIFYIGTLPADNTNKVAIIGSRRCSEYGLLTARLLAKPLAQAGVVVVSGMARGVDSMAHRGALQGGGDTIAVVGSGVDICYPADNKPLRLEIIQSGCVLSEYPPGTRPTPAFFPARNRIISGLCQGVVVTEAAKKSGTLITVNQAMEQGREVLAVPGNISSKLSQGTNQLIREGAHPISDHTDILFALNITPVTAKLPDNKKIPGQNLAPDEKRVYDGLSESPISFDMLADITATDHSKLHLICTKLELKGLAKKLPGARYILN